MCSLLVHQELKDIKSYLLTRVEYAKAVREASERCLKGVMAEYDRANLNLKLWVAQNPEPQLPPTNPRASKAAKLKEWFAHEKWQTLKDLHSFKWYQLYGLAYSSATRLHQLKLNIKLAELIENGTYETECQNYKFFEHYGGVNNPLLTHGRNVSSALYNHIDVPEHILAEWPEIVAQVREDMKYRAV